MFKRTANCGCSPNCGLCNGPRNTVGMGVSITNYGMGVNCFQGPCPEFLQYFGSVYGCWPQPPWRGRLFQMQHDSPSAFLCQGFSGKLAFVGVIGVLHCRRQSCQGISNLGCQLMNNIDRLCAAMLPVVLDLDQPARIGCNTDDVNGLGAFCDGLELVSIEGPIIVLAGSAVGRKAERQRPFIYCVHASDPVLDMKRSTNRSD